MIKIKTSVINIIYIYAAIQIVTLAILIRYRLLVTQAQEKVDENSY